MRFPSPAILGLSLATALLAPIEARAQAGPGGPPAPNRLGFGDAARSGPGLKTAPGIGGTITGRMNLIGPSETATAAPPLSAPTAVPAPIFSPQRLDTLNPAALSDIKLPGLAPGSAVRPVMPAPKPHGTPPAVPGSKAPEQAALTPSTVPAPVAPIKQRLTLAANFAEAGARIPSGVKWRLFTDQADSNGEHMLVAESSDASPRFEVDPGAYIVHAVYGLVSAAKFVQVKAGQPSEQSVVLSAGAVRLTAFVGAEEAAAGSVTFKLTREIDGVTRTAAENVKAGELLRLPAGRYHVTSLFGDANATVEADLTVAAGKLVDAQVHHKASKVTLKLVQHPGGFGLQDTSWTVLTPGGDVIRESIGALEGLVLAEGEYMAIARRDGQLYQQTFSVKAGTSANVEVVAR